MDLQFFGSLAPRRQGMSRVLYRAVIVAMLLVGFSTPARADVIVVENEAQFIATIQRLIGSRQDQRLRASRALETCYQNKHETCRVKMRTAMVELKSGVMLAGGVTAHFLAAVRNNSFSYERAYSLLFLNALVQGKRGATCAEFNREAELPLADGQVRTLADHLKNAEAEVGQRQNLPEYQMLLGVQTTLGLCVGRM